MSSVWGIVNLARTVYLEVRPYLPPVVQIILTVALGATVFGPGGVFVGAGVGAALTVPQVQRWLRVAFGILSGLQLLVQYNPNVLRLIRECLEKIRRYLVGEPIANDNVVQHLGQ